MPILINSFQRLYVFLVLLLHNIPAPEFIAGVEGTKLRCMEKERQALLQFKQGLVDDYGILSSWKSGKERDCCEWKGVGCNNRTGRITLLDLHHVPKFSAIPYNGSLRGKISDSLLELKHLNHLDLSRNDFNESPFPNFIGSLTNLRYLNLSASNLVGTLSFQFGNLSRLQSLDLSDNSINLESLDWLSHLSFLEELHLSWTNRSEATDWLQVVTELPHLKDLQLIGCSLSNITPRPLSDWVPSFQLDRLQLTSCNLGPHFPRWLRNQNNLSVLDISDAGISDSIPNWFGDLSNSKLNTLNLSHNKMSGILPDLSSKYSNLWTVDLSFNQFEGPLPLFSNLSNNIFSGPFVVIPTERFNIIDLSNNHFSGSGQLSNWIMHLPRTVVILNLANNNLSGEIPSSIGSLVFLQTLSLQNNSFKGELPLSLWNCKNLAFLDLSLNKLQGEIPAGVGNMPHLKFLSLRSNEFNGSIPPQLCQLTFIQILDLSINNITGIIPKCLHKLTAMVQKIEYPSYDTAIISFYRYYFNKASVEWKGKEYDYQSILGLLRIINFAGNRLIGEIPEQITGLLQLVALNLSGNNLTGAIPQEIGHLKQLQSLDLSGNQLSGIIPPSMAELNFLNHLNLSYNNLSGKIPTSTQLQSFNASVFSGNLALCGLPVPKKCPGDEMLQSPPSNDHQGNETVVDELMKWFCIAMGISFGVFFWGVSGALLLKRSWRHAYFRLLDKSWDWLYVKIAVQKARLQRAGLLS